jgi:hypothetical protein
MGATVERTSTLINRRFKVHTGKSTIHAWVRKYTALCPIQNVRAKYVSMKDLVVSRQFDHENLPYEFLYHRYKLQVYTPRRYRRFIRYIQGFEQGCPDEFFEVGERCSHPKFRVDAPVRRQVNLACRMARFAVQAKWSNRERHQLVERFMLCCDTATIACEVPVWYWEKSIDRGITGHIDLVQIRRGALVIMDYKPGAAADRKAMQQLYHYAVALSFRTGVPFEQIRCAWFDEHQYFEYQPAAAQVKLMK